MKKLLCILLLAGLSFLLSCEGAGYCNLEGNVYEEGSNIPIHNVYVRINKYNRSPFKEATTDKNGHFKIKYFKSAGNAKISLDIISGEHISLLNKPVTSKNANISAYLTPYGWVRFRVKNNTSTNMTVYASMPEQQTYVPAMSSPANSDLTFSATQRVIINKYRKFSWYYYQTSPNTYLGTFNDSVLVTNKWDTLTYLIQLN